MNEDERKIQWCLRKERGISLIEPNENLARAYVVKAKEAAEVMRTLREQSTAWAMSACHYSMYYSLYAIMTKLGIKSEIHSCSMTFMRYALKVHFDETDVKMLERAFGARIDLQYYVTKIPKAEKADELFESAILFYKESQDVLLKIDEKFIGSARKRIRSLM